MIEARQADRYLGLAFGATRCLATSTSLRRWACRQARSHSQPLPSR
jgi:hypothetical protein